MLMRAVAVVLICMVPAPLLAQSDSRLRIPREIVTPPDKSIRPAMAPAPKGGRDSVMDGALVGAVVLGAWCAIVCGQGLDNAGQLPLAVLAAAGYGALIGAGIDAMQSRTARISHRKRW